MAVSLLQTKLFVPLPWAELIPRPRLMKRLDERRKLTLVSAPAGFGKTTLLGAWVEALSSVSHPVERVAWLSLDAPDDDPTRFWSYIIAALQTIHPNIGETALAMLQTPQPPPVETVLTALLNEIAALPEPLALVLDDYHLIKAPAIHEAVVFLLGHLPPQMRLIILTRADPPLPLARLRVRGHLIELRAADLRFTTDETAAFLSQVMGLDLAADDVAALETRTEGWVAGLQMAAISMRERGGIPGFVRAFAGSHRYILDYLGEEVLCQQPRDVQDFLLQTAILDRLSGELCDAVIKASASPERRVGAHSQSMLEYLERNNLFVVSLDDGRHWYRYHHLFADLLRQRLQWERRDLVSTLHRRASEWYEQNGLIAEAVGHALTSGYFERAACLIQQTGWATFTRGEMTTILGWIAALPDDFVRSRPQLGVLHAWAMAKSGHLDGVEPCLQGIDPHGLQGEVAAVRAYVAGVRGDLSRAVELAQQALEHLPEENLFLRAIVTQNLGVAYHWSGDSAAAVQTLTKAVKLGRAANQTFQALTALAILGRAHEMQGSLRQAIETCKEALELAFEPGDRPVPFVGMAYVGMAGPLYEWNDLDGAMRYAMEGIRLSELGGFVAYQVFGYALLARIYEAQGDRNSAVQVLQKAERLGQGYSYALVMALVAEWRIRLWVAQGNMAAASRWAQERRLSSVGELDSAREIEQTAVAWVLITQGRPGEALRLLAWLLEAAQAVGRMGSAIKILALQALAFQAQDNLDGALSALERALSLAEPEGYVRTFVDEGEPMTRLLRRALSQGIAPNYVARLLAAFGQEVELTSPAMGSLVEPLSERELQVLRLLAEGKSNRDIGEELFIAVGTVKKHLSNIFGKLGVQNRTECAARARELGLI
jgi:LuxR family maltose regulon positive regulatory protein